MPLQCALKRRIGRALAAIHAKLILTARQLYSDPPD